MRASEKCRLSPFNDQIVNFESSADFLGVRTTVSEVEPVFRYAFARSRNEARRGVIRPRPLTRV